MVKSEQAQREAQHSKARVAWEDELQRLKKAYEDADFLRISEVTSATSDHTSAEARNDELADQVATLTDQIERMTEDASVNVSHCVELKKEVERLTKDTTELRASAASAAQKSVATHTALHETSVATESRCAADLEKLRDEHEAVLRERLDDLAAAASQLETAESKIVNLTSKVERHVTEYKALCAEQSDATEKTAARIALVAELEIELEELHDGHAAALTSHEDTHRQIGEVHAAKIATMEKAHEAGIYLYVMTEYFTIIMLTILILIGEVQATVESLQRANAATEEAQREGADAREMQVAKNKKRMAQLKVANAAEKAKGERADALYSAASKALVEERAALAAAELQIAKHESRASKQGQTVLSLNDSVAEQKAAIAALTEREHALLERIETATNAHADATALGESDAGACFFFSSQWFLFLNFLPFDLVCLSVCTLVF